MIIVDASVMLAVVFPEQKESHEYAVSVFEQTQSKRMQLVAPRIITAEVTYQLLKQGRRRHWGEARTAEYAEVLDLVQLRLITLTTRMASFVRYAWRHNVQGYDAQYIALAEHFKAPIATLDRGQISAAKALGLELA